MQQVRRKERGFTIIELVVVILLLGILAAVALPRFINVTDRAYGSAVQGVYGGFATGVAMYRAQYVAEGQPLTVTIDTNTLAFHSDSGYPAIESAAACIAIWNSVLQSGRPSISDTVTPVATPGSGLVASDLDSITGTNIPDFVAYYDEGVDPAADPASCYYVYAAQYGADTGDAAADTVSVILYSEDSTLELIYL